MTVSIGGEVVLDHDHRVVVLKDQVCDVLTTKDQACDVLIIDDVACDVLRASDGRGVDLLKYQVRSGREWPASQKASVPLVVEASVHLFEASVHLVDEDAQEHISEMVISLGFQ